MVLCGCNLVGKQTKVESVSWHAQDTTGSSTGSDVLRPLAVSLLCGMAHSTQRTRAELWAHSGLDLLLHLLAEEVNPLALIMVFCSSK